MHKILLDDFLKEILKEDIGRGDLYLRLPSEMEVESYIVAKEDGVLSGVFYVERLCELLKIKSNFFWSNWNYRRYLRKNFLDIQMYRFYTNYESFIT